MFDKNVPGPGKYDILKPFGKDSLKFTIKGRERNLSLLEASKIPGPGSYKVPGINAEGKFPLSTISNSMNIKFGNRNDHRFNYKGKVNLILVNNIPGPSHYDIKPLINGTGKNFLSKFKNSAPVSMSGKPNVSNKTISKKS
jgi:hypothetical protein